MIRTYCVMKYIAFSLFLLARPIAEAQKNPNQMLHGVYQKMLKVTDYSVEAIIRADIPLIKILPVNAVIYFKQPDHIKFKSKGIVILPRQSFNDVSKIISDTVSNTAVFTGKEKIGNSLTQIISVIPSVDTGNLILGKFWIDYTKNLVLKSQLTTRSSGTLLIEFFYNAQLALGLPDKMILTVDIKKFKIPKAMASDVDNPKKITEKEDKDSKKGIITIDLNNYKINQGLNDAFFKN